MTRCVGCDRPIVKVGYGMWIGKWTRRLGCPFGPNLTHAAPITNTNSDSTKP